MNSFIKDRKMRMFVFALIYATCYFLSNCVFGIRENSIIGFIFKNFVIVLVRSGNLSIFIYFAYEFKDIFLKQIELFRTNKLVIIYFIVGLTILITTSQLYLLDYRELNNGIFTINIIQGVVGSYCVLIIGNYLSKTALCKVLSILGRKSLFLMTCEIYLYILKDVVEFKISDNSYINFVGYVIFVISLLVFVEPLIDNMIRKINKAC